MASYPTAVKTFTSKNAGETIQPSHVNDAQDEINAIEDGLLNGLNHAVTISTGGLTVSTGNTVLGQNLNVAGGSTFAGNVTITGSLTAAISVPSVLVKHDAAQEVAVAAWTGLSWNTEVRDTAGMHSTASNSSRLTFADSTGLYCVTANVPLSSIASGFWDARIIQNDSSVVSQFTFPNGLSNSAMGVPLQAFVRVSDTTDYVTVQVNTSASTGRALADATGAAMRFAAYRVST